MPNKKRVDWNTIRAEYISGGIGYRKLASKYNVPFSTLSRRAKVEEWTILKAKAEHKVNTEVTQKTADAAADNATIAQRILSKLLIRLEQEVDALPDGRIGSACTVTKEQIEIDSKGHPVKTRSTIEYRLRELAVIYKALTDYLQLDGKNGDDDLLRSLYDLMLRNEGRGDDDISPIRQ